MVRRESRAAIRMGITNPMMNLLLNIGLTLVILVGAYRVNEGSTQPGVIIAFLSYFTIILNAMLTVTRMFVMYSRASASAGRIQEVPETPEDMELTDEPKKNEEEHIVFENVSFSYKNKSVKNIDNISFKLKREKHWVLSAQPARARPPSSICSCACTRRMRAASASTGRRFPPFRRTSCTPSLEWSSKMTSCLPILSARILILAETCRSSASSRQLFLRRRWSSSTPCRSGLSIWSPQEEPTSAADKSRGVLLSRALAGNSEILIPDDSSSALDYKTDSQLRSALREQYDGITTIVIAQRVSSILHADHILVLDEGKEIGYGTHEQLMESCAVYREISESQMGGDFG